MSQDPIIETFNIAFRRCLLFVLLSLLLAAILWCWLLKSQFDVPARDLIDWARATWSPTGKKVLFVFACGSLTIGTLTTTVVYLLIGRWWKKRGDVHRRGARFDEREM